MCELTEIADTLRPFLHGDAEALAQGVRDGVLHRLVVQVVQGLHRLALRLIVQILSTLESGARMKPERRPAL